MPTFVSDFEPRSLWAHFDRILTIPRPSKQEEAMRRYVIEIAERKGVPHRSDAAGNLVVSKPGAAGREGAPTTILQSHLDMVTEKNSDVAHDFDRDPIKPRLEGEYLYATGTTLGADNGIGVAAMLALLDADDVAHGPLELLFTVDEETGLTGANQLDPALLSGRRLLNLDSEEEGAVTVGCAGGRNTQLTVPLEREAATPQTPGAVALEVALSGLKGGHSGVDIHLQRGNAVKLLARTLVAAAGKAPFRLASLTGGNKHNAIPREAKATVLLAPEARAAFAEAIEREAAAIQAEYRPADPDLRIEVREASAASDAWTEDSTRRVLALIEALPHGVIAMSYDIPGLVETSANVATVAAANGSLSVLMSLRSSVASALDATARRVRTTGGLANAKVTENDGYPGWKPDLASPVLAVVRRVHERTLGSDPEIKAIHAGLECGIIGEKVPGTDMISFGPQIENPHSPDERVHVASVERFWKLLTATLEELAS